MTSKEDPRSTRGQTGAEQADASGLAEMLTGLLGGGGSAPLQALLGKLGGGQNSETEGLSPELLSALAKTPAAGATASPIPDALKRAAEALGLSPALVEKLLPGILSQLPALGQSNPQPPASSSIHKQPEAKAEAPAKPAKPRKPSSKPAASTAAKKPKASESAAAKKPKTSESTTAKKPKTSEGGKTPKAGSTRKPSGSSSKPRSGSSGGTKRKPKSEPDAIGLDDILNALIK